MSTFLVSVANIRNMIIGSKAGWPLSTMRKMVDFKGLVRIVQYLLSGKAFWKFGNRVIVCLDYDELGTW